MEPFGLFNLLSALLPQTEQNAQPRSSAPLKPEAAPTEPQENEEPTPAPPSPSVNPCTEFLEAHEKRIRQTRVNK